MLQNPKIGVGVIIKKDNKVLFLKRKNSHGDGTWSVPGGHLEFNEEIESCAKREVAEETGLKIKNLRFVAITNDIFKNEMKHYITIFMVCDYLAGEAAIKEPEKCSALGWFECDSLPSPLFLPIENLLRQGHKL